MLAPLFVLGVGFLRSSAMKVCMPRPSFILWHLCLLGHVLATDFESDVEVDSSYIVVSG